MDTDSSSLERLPTRLDAAIFAVKAALLRFKRGFTDALYRDVKRWPRVDNAGTWHLWSESISVLDSGDRSERALVLGKIENLRVALRAIGGVQVDAGGTFSFWTQVGRARAARGYVAGRELREGCIIATIGGGLCQLSNGLYQAALDAGLTIIERHAHSQVVPGSAAQAGRDATVFWNYIDLRFGSNEPFRIEAELEQGQLRVRILKTRRSPAPARSAPMLLMRETGGAPRSCHSCGETACFRRVPGSPEAALARSAFMVDALWSEFDIWISANRSSGDTLLLPMQGRAQYGWSSAGFAEVKTFRILTIWRGLATRRLASQGAARQEAAMRFRRRLAQAYVDALDHLTEHVVLTQELLPYVWQSGALQGRSFDVLMTGMPIAHLQAVLDAAHARHPYSATLADFRAPPALAQLEMHALRRARKIITPHVGVAALFDNAELLPWAHRSAATNVKGTRIVFAASTLARKGAYEMRDAARELGLRLTLLGPVLEADGFWDGVQVERAHDLRDAAVVVLPAWVESRPARLLAALEHGIPVIATHACGLPPQPNLTIIAAGDSAALVASLLPWAQNLNQPRRA